ncbi:MAG: TetR/AcrR family transcriptional regulator [Spirochaetales bacterium]|nr:TetR/AcrR family transcriptional regulator [Spirochaetales bacterium]
MKRTTMNDIAQEAGIVRRTLYNAFVGKDEVLRGTIRHHDESAVAAVKDEWKRSELLGDRLDIALEHTTAKPFEVIRAMPEARDVIDGFNAAGKQEAVRAAELYRQRYEEAFAPYEAALRERGLLQLADFVRNAADSVKSNATDKDHLLELLNTLTAVVLAAVGRDEEHNRIGSQEVSSPKHGQNGADR